MLLKSPEIFLDTSDIFDEFLDKNQSLEQLCMETFVTEFCCRCVNLSRNSKTLKIIFLTHELFR